MRRLPRRAAITLAALCLALLLAGTLWAQGGNFDLPWWTVEGGGGRSLGGDFILDGTIAQPGAGLQQGGVFDLNGGFWRGVCGAAPPNPEAQISAGGGIELSWTTGGGSGRSDIFRSLEEPYFTPDLPYAAGVVPPWADPDESGGGRRFYLVRLVDGCGGAADSGRLGAIEFPLIPGS